MKTWTGVYLKKLYSLARYRRLLLDESNTGCIELLRLKTLNRRLLESAVLLHLHKIPPSSTVWQERNNFAIAWHETLSESFFFSDRSAAKLQVNYSGQFLDAVQQEVALFDRFLVLPVLAVRPVRFDHSADLVDLAMQPSDCDESRQLPENKRIF